MITQAQGGCLVSNGKLLGLPQADDLSRRIPDKLLQRSGQMRLIEIASLINGVEDRNPLLYEGQCMLSTYHLPNVGGAQSCCSQESMPHRAGWHLLRVAL